jgi:hypothetical protein
MKHVTIYSDCRFNYSTREGSYFAALEYNGNIKRISGAIAGENETGNRAIIYGLIEAVKLLKEPCQLTILTSTPIGFKKTFRSPTGKSRNGDLILRLAEIIFEKGCVFNYGEIPKEEVYSKTLSRRFKQ